jgi:hypothetical protein
LVNNFN